MVLHLGNHLNMKAMGTWHVSRLTKATSSHMALKLMHLKGRMCRILVKGVCSQAKTARINSWVKVLVAQLCPTLCDLMDCGLPGSSVHGILQARILRWVVIPFSRGSSRPGDRTCASCTAGGFFTI